MSDQKQDDTREFIREKIVRPPLTRRQIACRAAFLIGSAAVFGAVAAAAFALVRPLAERHFSGAAEESTSIEFASDETDASLSPEESRAEETLEAEAEQQKIADEVSEAISKYTFSAADVANMNSALSAVADGLDHSIVTVTTGVQQTDVFGNPVESTGSAAGFVIAKTGSDALILTCARSVLGVENVQVQLKDGTKTEAQLRQNDSVLGLTVLSVPLAALSENQNRDLTVMPLGSSYSVGRGDLLVAVGAPAGRTWSTASGSVAMSDSGVSMPDFSGVILYADCGSSSAGTYFVNTSGELIGWADDSLEKSGGMTPIMAISPVKKTLEKLTNGLEIPYFGIRMQDVTEDMKSSGIPAGVYVTEAVAESPAYASGIQNGDIIVKYGETTVTTASGLQEQIAASQPGTSVPVTVMRAGRNGYEAVSFSVEIRKR